jgi:hypothetical protein
VLTHRFACAVAAVALLGVAALPAAAAAGADPANAQLAKALKVQMQRTYRTKVPGLVFTKVTCLLATNHQTAHCKAAFTRTSKNVKGVYQVAIVVDTSTGGVNWGATSVACTRLRTGAKVVCPR